MKEDRTSHVSIVRRWVSNLFCLGTKSGMPKYTLALLLLQVATLLLPESFWAYLHVDALNIRQRSPSFIRYYIDNSDFKNAMSIFWVIAPCTSVISTVICVRHINIVRYEDYLRRRSIRLRRTGKAKDYSIIIGVLFSMALYVWSTALYQVEPTILGSFVPPNNRFAMLIVHAGALGGFFPFALATLIAEIRANLSTKTFF
jgi:hypothetical protein